MEDFMKFLACFMLLMVMPLAALAVPNYINYQGRLLDNNGIPITQSGMTMVVSIWTAPTAGTKLYQENQTVNVDDGVYTFQIGNGTGGTPAWNPASLFNTSSPRFVELTVQGQTLTPRMQLLSAPFTLQSGNSDNLGGQPISYFGTVAGENSLQNQITALQGQVDLLQQKLDCNSASGSKWSKNNNFCFGGTPKNCAQLDFSGESFAGVYLVDAVCTGASFKGTDFRGADFEGKTDFSGADFTNANVTGVIWGVGITCPNGSVIQRAGDSCLVKG
jgi:hypothetical protein